MNYRSNKAELMKAQIAKWERATESIHVDNPAAYEAFRDGKVVFGLISEAQKIKNFREDITPRIWHRDYRASR